MDTQIERRLMTYVNDELLDGQGADLTRETPLLELGVVDSFGIVKLLSFAERELDVTIHLEDMTMADMKDIASIAALIARRRGATRDGDRR